MGHKDIIDKNLIFDTAVFDDSMEVHDVLKMCEYIYGDVPVTMYFNVYPRTLLKKSVRV